MNASTVRKPRSEGARRSICDGFDQAGGATCKACFEKTLEIDRLRADVTRLKQHLNHQEHRVQDSFFGKATPSSKLPAKSNSVEENRAKRGGAGPGHKDHGRRLHRWRQPTASSPRSGSASPSLLPLLPSQYASGANCSLSWIATAAPQS